MGYGTSYDKTIDFRECKQDHVQLTTNLHSKLHEYSIQWKHELHECNQQQLLKGEELKVYVNQSIARNNDTLVNDTVSLDLLKMEQSLQESVSIKHMSIQRDNESLQEKFVVFKEDCRKEVEVE